MHHKNLWFKEVHFLVLAHGSVNVILVPFASVSSTHWASRAPFRVGYKKPKKDSKGQSVQMEDTLIMLLVIRTKEMRRRRRQKKNQINFSFVI